METALNAQELNQLKDMVRTKGLNATARAIGIGKATLHRILHGATPAAETAGKIIVCLKGDMVTDGPAPAKKKSKSLSRIRIRKPSGKKRTRKSSKKSNCTPCLSKRA